MRTTTSTFAKPTAEDAAARLANNAVLMNKTLVVYAKHKRINEEARARYLGILKATGWPDDHAPSAVLLVARDLVSKMTDMDMEEIFKRERVSAAFNDQYILDRTISLMDRDDRRAFVNAVAPVKEGAVFTWNNRNHMLSLESLQHVYDPLDPTKFVFLPVTPGGELGDHFVAVYNGETIPDVTRPPDVNFGYGRNGSIAAADFIVYPNAPGEFGETPDALRRIGNGARLVQPAASRAVGNAIYRVDYTMLYRIGSTPFPGATEADATSFIFMGYPTHHNVIVPLGAMPARRNEAAANGTLFPSFAEAYRALRTRQDNSAGPNMPPATIRDTIEYARRVPTRTTAVIHLLVMYRTERHPEYTEETRFQSVSADEVLRAIR